MIDVTAKRSPAGTMHFMHGDAEGGEGGSEGKEATTGADENGLGTERKTEGGRRNEREDRGTKGRGGTD